MKKPDDDSRREKRVEPHLVLRTKQLKPLAHNQPWDVSTVRNISKTGLLFYSTNYYDYGADIEIRIMNPMIQKEIACQGTIVRCELLTQMKGVYSIAVKITKVASDTKEAFDKTIEFFINKK